MKNWRLIWRITSDSEASRDPGALKRDINNFIRVVETYEVKCLGMRMLGIDFLAEDHEFNHIMRLVKILEARYRLSIMQFSEFPGESDPGMTIKIGSKPATSVA